MRRKKAQSKGNVGVLETFGGPYHRFEAVFEPRVAKPSSKPPKKNGGKGKRRKGGGE